MSQQPSHATVDRIVALLDANRVADAVDLARRHMPADPSEAWLFGRRVGTAEGRSAVRREIGRRGGSAASPAKAAAARANGARGGRPRRKAQHK